MEPFAVLTPVRAVTLVVFLANCYMLLVYARREPQMRGYIIPVFLWSLHTALFYAAIAYRHAFGVEFPVFALLGITYMDWSGVVRLHGGITVLAILAGTAVTRRYDAGRSNG